MREKAKAGWVAGGVVFGHDDLRLGKGHVERRINEAEAAIVREIYERFAAGDGARNIAQGVEPRESAGAPRAARPDGRLERFDRSRGPRASSLPRRGCLRANGDRRSSRGWSRPISPCTDWSQRSSSAPPCPCRRRGSTKSQGEQTGANLRTGACEPSSAVTDAGPCGLTAGSGRPDNVHALAEREGLRVPGADSLRLERRRGCCSSTMRGRRTAD